MKRIYLAVPYSDKEKEVREQRFLWVTQIANIKMRDGSLVYSPITHGHTIGEFGILPTDFSFWRVHCLSFLTFWAEELHVLTLPGWECSQGVTAEIQEAKLLGLPIIYIDHKNQPVSILD